MDIRSLYEEMFQKYGDLRWWPADTSEEVIIGAVLTQNTSWKNVEISISKLKENGSCSLQAISKMDEEKLKEQIRSSGFFNRKAQVLKKLSDSVIQNGGMESLNSWKGEELDYFFSHMFGIGKETLDSILLYAFHRRRFVVDKYTNNFFSRIGLLKENENAEAIREKIEGSFSVYELKNFHAMIVNIGKDHCRVKPQCAWCFMNNSCNHAKETMFP